MYVEVVDGEKGEVQDSVPQYISLRIAGLVSLYRLTLDCVAVF